MNLLLDAPDQEFWLDETNRGTTIVPAFANAYISFAQTWTAQHPDLMQSAASAVVFVSAAAAGVRRLWQHYDDRLRRLYAKPALEERALAERVLLRGA